LSAGRSSAKSSCNLASAVLPDNVGYLFDVPLKVDPQRVVVFQGDLTLSFEELDARCNRVANALAGLGVRAGQRVALMFSNDYRFFEALLGAMRLGAVPVPLNIRMGDEALAYVVNDAEASVLVANATLAERACILRRGLAGVKHLIADAKDREGAIEYASVVDAASPVLPRRKTEPDEVCMQPYTSGSTGRPKGVLLTHGGQIWNTDILRKATMVDHSERGLVAVPLYHKNAMAGVVKPFLLAGGAIVLLPAFDPLEVIKAIDRYKVTYLTGVPAMYKMMLAETQALRQYDVRSVRFAMCGSAEVPDELLSDFRRAFNAPIAESYGLTEGGPVPLTNTRWGLKKRGSCGREIPGCDVKIVDDEGRQLGDDQVGELATRNPGLAKGYWKLPEATAKRFRDGWLYTGDLMRRDRDGYYYFVGRKDDMINVGGENVYPKEVEDILLRHPNLKDACVVPAPHEVKGTVPVAFVALREKGKTTEAELKQFFLERGAPYAHPRRIYFLDALPLGSTGKLDRNALKTMATAETKA
jgi:long-chain acyl-CoA synthetase